jgi:hypothetical protein
MCYFFSALYSICNSFVSVLINAVCAFYVSFMFLLRTVPYPDDGPHKGPIHICYNKWLDVLDGIFVIC